MKICKVSEFDYNDVVDYLPKEVLDYVAILEANKKNVQELYNDNLYLKGIAGLVTAVDMVMETLSVEFPDFELIEECSNYEFYLFDLILDHVFDDMLLNLKDKITT